MRFTRITRLFSLLVLTILSVGASGAYGQITGDIQVRVADPTGAVIPNAKVTIRNKDTGTDRTTVTSPDGVARITQLGIGTYEVRVEASGFATFSTDATVNSGAVTTIPANLEISTATQTVTVEEGASLLSTVSSQLQTTADATKITSLPI